MNEQKSLSDKEKKPLQSHSEQVEVKLLADAQQLTHYYEKAQKQFFFRRIFSAFFGFLVFLVIIIFLLPIKPKPFDPIDALSYEILAVYEEGAQERLDVFSEDKFEILTFLSKNSDLGFVPHLLYQLPANWSFEGAAMLDYEIAQIAMLAYRDKKTSDRVFHFSLKGDLSHLAPSERGTAANVRYRVYFREHLNLLAWQSDKQTLSIIAAYLDVGSLKNLFEYSVALSEANSSVQE